MVLGSFEMQGIGLHPSQDPWNIPFSETYYPELWKIAGSRIAGPWTFCLDGVQGDADFIAAIFDLKRSIAQENGFCKPLRI